MGQKRVILIRSRPIDSAVFKLASALTSGGYNVRLIIWDRQNTIDHSLLQDFNIDIFRLRAKYDNINAVIRIPFWWLFILLKLLKYKPDFIHACDFDTLPPAILAKLLLRKPLLYTIFDFYASSLENLKIPSFIVKIVAHLEKIGISFTSALFLVDPIRYQQIRGAKIHYIDFVFNSPPDIQQEFTNQAAPQLDSSTKIFYAGSLTRARGIQLMLDTIYELDNVSLTLIGEDIDNLILSIPRNQANKISYLGWKPYGFILKKMLEFDIMFALYDPVFEQNKLASPNKVFEAMMARLPIIINKEIAASRIVKKWEFGILVSYGKNEELKNAIKFLINNPDIRRKFGLNGRKAYEEHYSWEKMKQKIFKAYHEII